MPVMNIRHVPMLVLGVDVSVFMCVGHGRCVMFVKFIVTVAMFESSPPSRALNVKVSGPL